MEAQFSGESFSMGFLEALFLVNKQLTESECKRYLDLAKKLNQIPNEDILKYSKRLNLTN